MKTHLVNRSTQLLALLCLLGVIVTGCTGYPPLVVTSDAPLPASAPAAPSPVVIVLPSVQTVPAAIAAPSSDLAVSAAVPASASGAYWPTEGWRTSSPEAQGMDSQRLAQMVAVIRERKINVHSLLVIRHGYLVNETYFGSWDKDYKHDMQSVGRSFSATLIGIAIDKGYIAGVDQRIVDLFSDRKIANLDKLKEAMTLEDVLTMRSGLDWLEAGDSRTKQQASLDWVQFLLDRPMSDPPGTRWNYCSGCSHLFSAILQQKTGINPRDFAEQYLFKPLGIRDVKWMTDPAGIPYGAGGFPLTPRDMAKLGYLYLRNGQWDGQQIVSAKWVRAATTKYTEIGVDPHFGYGYHWFTFNSRPGYAAIGNLGQIIFVIPEDDLVIVTTAATEESIFQLIEEYVFPAVISK